MDDPELVGMVAAGVPHAVGGVRMKAHGHGHPLGGMSALVHELVSEEHGEQEAELHMDQDTQDAESDRGMDISGSADDGLAQDVGDHDAAQDVQNAVALSALRRCVAAVGFSDFESLFLEHVLHHGLQTALRGPQHNREAIAGAIASSMLSPDKNPVLADALRKLVLYVLDSTEDGLPLPSPRKRKGRRRASVPVLMEPIHIMPSMSAAGTMTAMPMPLGAPTLAGHMVGLGHPALAAPPTLLSSMMPPAVLVPALPTSIATAIPAVDVSALRRRIQRYVMSSWADARAVAEAIDVMWNPQVKAPVCRCICKHDIVLPMETGEHRVSWSSSNVYRHFSVCPHFGRPEDEMDAAAFLMAVPHTGPRLHKRKRRQSASGLSNSPPT